MSSGSDEVDTGSQKQGQSDEMPASAETEEAYKTEEDPISEKGEDKSIKSCVTKMLDELDIRVEKLRSDAIKVDAERDDVLTSLDALINSQLVHSLEGVELDEVTRYIQRLAQRSAAVRVEISTERSASQQESLHMVNTLIDAMIREVKTNVVVARRRCISYMNSCSDGSDNSPPDHCGIDAPFEAAVLGCTIEDQKRVKKRLIGLFSYFSTFSPELSEIEEESEQCGNQSGTGPNSSSATSV